MKKSIQEGGICQITKKRFPMAELIKGRSIRAPLLTLIRKDAPDFDIDGFISKNEFEKYRQRYLQQLLEQEKGELSFLEKEVIEKIKNSEILSKNIEDDVYKRLTTGQRMADMVARFGGSWAFVSSFFVFIAFWIGLNVFVLVKHPFDPYPFILLNLLLSCVAAIQAPIIMMSQNRQETKDRLRAQHDYQINLKAELEIQQLHEKLDHLIVVQMQRLLEIQQLQVDYMEEIISMMEGKTYKPE